VQLHEWQLALRYLTEKIACQHVTHHPTPDTQHPIVIRHSNFVIRTSRFRSFAIFLTHHPTPDTQHPIVIRHSNFVIRTSRFRSFAALFLTVLVVVLFASCRGKSNIQRVVIYSPHGKELLQDYEKQFEQKYPGVDVQWLYMGSQDVVDRLRSEKANPQADVWFGAPNTMFSQAAGEGLLESYRPSWAGNVPASARGRNDFWYGTYFTPEVIAFSTNAVPRDVAPKDWDDLLIPRWKNRIIIYDPVASGTMRTIFGAILFRYQRRGDLEKGFDWLRRLDANTKEYAANPALMFQKIARGEADVTLWNMPDIELQRKVNHYPLGYVFPSSGTPYLTEGIALIRGGKHQEWAKKYYEFVTSEESLILAAENYFRIPARTDIAPSRLPGLISRARTEVHPMDLDWNVLALESRAWMKRWENEIKGSGK
jgi:iron(III) transport system substrate-binding protein